MDIEEVKNYFENMKDNDSIGHAYLFSNVNYDEVEDVVSFFSNKIFLKNSSSIEDNPDIYFIEPEKNVIKKEKILELEKFLNRTSQINDNKLYIIKECEKMNLSASNCLLKTLEEPENNIYAILITSDLDLVIPTIKSRCQIIKFKSLKHEKFDEEFINKSISMMKILENNGANSIAYNSNDLYKSFEKDELKKVLYIIENFYNDCLNYMYGIKMQYFDDYKDEVLEVISNNDVNKIIGKIKVLNDNINILKYNLNGNLFMDKLLIEFGRL